MERFGKKLSKTEAEKAEILPAPYNLSSMVNDVVNIICTLLNGKPIRFFTNIDPLLPRELNGDELWIRQILLKLLGNAVKFTERGFIGISIVREETGRLDQVCLRIDVSDSGQGIKLEDQKELFGDIVQVDTIKNRSIENKGLAIIKRLCVMMGGDLSLYSVYGKGSVFTALLPQSVESQAPIASVNKPEDKHVLIYERRLVNSESISWSLNKLMVPNTLVTNEADFDKALAAREWFYVIVGYGLHKQILPRINKIKKRPELALLVERGVELPLSQQLFFSMPLQAFSLAIALNKNEGFFESQTATPARFLVVDDIAANLKAAEGLLSPYGAVIDTCLSGAEAVIMVKQRAMLGEEYDIVFMDHLMPGMDGIEATAAIRLLEGEGFKSLPIIALTPNTASGMKEMFLGKGFNDCLAKPIDMFKLDEILCRWVPKGKRIS